MSDSRLVVGNYVIAKAIHITSVAECARRFGSLYKEKIILGIVRDVVIDTNNVGGRKLKKVTADFELDSCITKRKSLPLCSVKEYTLPVKLAPSLIEVEDVVKTMEGSVAVAAAAAQHETTPPPAFKMTTKDNTTLQCNSKDVQLPGIETQLQQQSPAVSIASFQTNGSSSSTTTSASTTTNTEPEHNKNATVTCHGTKWYIDNAKAGKSINGPVYTRNWSVVVSTGEQWAHGCNRDMLISRLDVFLQMFPPVQLRLIVRLTNQQLERYQHQLMTSGELLKFFGLLILATKFEFTSRASLWSKTSLEKFESAPNFGRTGMHRDRFDTIFRHIRFSEQPTTRPDHLNSNQYRWMLVDDFVNNFNNHRITNFRPSELICVDESMVRWYGTGGEWINAGLPHYVAIDRKPENGCEIQDSCCGRSGVMLQLKIVKSTEDDDDSLIEEENGLLHGTVVLKQLVRSWFYTDRIVCADSYFASVGAAEELLRYRTRFIGVVKTATKRYPMSYLQKIETTGRGDRFALISYNNEETKEKAKYLAFCWVDRERRYFISSVSSMAPGTPWIRKRLRQIVDDDITYPHCVELVVPQPAAAEVYYSCCGKVDSHNRDRQDTLMLEHKVQTKEWSKRVNFSILAICVVDCWKVWKQITIKFNSEVCVESQKQFYSRLATELIENNFDRVGGVARAVRNRRRDVDDGELECSELIDPITLQPRSGTSTRLTPTKRKRKNKDGEYTNNTYQGRCLICKDKTIYQCSLCRDNAPYDKKNSVGFICYTSKGALCFIHHLKDKHPE